MKIECAISLGELVDKISILMIKEKMIKDEAKLVHVRHEKNVLENLLSSLALLGIDHYLQDMVAINTKLWQIEDDIREKERKKQFDEEFIELARNVYVSNDQRFAIKNKINNDFSSSIVEVKSYQEY